MKSTDTHIAPIESGIRVPIRSETTSFGKKISLSATIRKLESGQSFQIDKCEWRRRVTATAHFLKLKVKTQRLEDGKLRVIRL